jgi:Type IV secretion system pilin
MTNFFNKLIKQFFTFGFLILLVFGTAGLGSITANAQDAKGGIAFLQPSGIKCIFFVKDAKPPCTESESVIGVLTKFLQDIAPFVVTVLIIFGGYEYFVDEQAKKTSAKSTILSAISGYVVIILAPVITRVVTETFNGKGGNPIDTTALFLLFNQIIDLLINLSGIVSVVVIVLSGYAYFLQFFVNSGKQEGKLNGRELLIAGIMGLIVTTLAKPIVGFIKSTLTGNEGELSIKQENIIAFIKNVLANFLIPFASIVTLIFILAAAFMWLTAGSDETRVKNARSTLNGALIGLVIVLLSTTIVQLIVYFVQPAQSFIPGSSNANTIIQAGNVGNGAGTNNTPTPIPTRPINP